MSEVMKRIAADIDAAAEAKDEDALLALDEQILYELNINHSITFEQSGELQGTLWVAIDEVRQWKAEHAHV